MELNKLKYNYFHSNSFNTTYIIIDGEIIIVCDGDRLAIMLNKLYDSSIIYPIIYEMLKLKFSSKRYKKAFNNIYTFNDFTKSILEFKDNKVLINGKLVYELLEPCCNFYYDDSNEINTIKYYYNYNHYALYIYNSNVMRQYSFINDKFIGASSIYTNCNVTDRDIELLEYVESMNIII